MISGSKKKLPNFKYFLRPERASEASEAEDIFLYLGVFLNIFYIHEVFLKYIKNKNNQY